MEGWQIIPEERLTVFSPIGLVLRDDFTGDPPALEVTAHLDFQDAQMEWHVTSIGDVRTPSAAITYPGLGRSANAAAVPVQRHRVRIESEFYRPDYLINADGIEFDVHAYDDQTPPAIVPGAPQTVFLLPSPRYAFPQHVRVLRGAVQDAAATPVANVEVSLGAQERTLSDERGQFALPLRWPALNGAAQIDALDHRTGLSGQINIALPGALSAGQVITIT